MADFYKNPPRTWGKDKRVTRSIVFKFATEAYSHSHTGTEQMLKRKGCLTEQI